MTVLISAATFIAGVMATLILEGLLQPDFAEDPDADSQAANRATVSRSRRRR